jgi:hypothetical protein
MTYHTAPGGLEKQVSVDFASSYNHAKIVEKLCRASYCTKSLIRRIRLARSKEQLTQLGYLVMDENIMIAHDIFTYTDEAAGRRLTRNKLYSSTDKRVQAYAYLSAFEEGDKYAREFGESLLKNKSNPYLAFQVFEHLQDLELLKQAVDQLRAKDPDLAAELQGKRFKEVERKTPKPYRIHIIKQE